jgi:hypothetical protein
VTAADVEPPSATTTCTGPTAVLGVAKLDERLALLLDLTTLYARDHGPGSHITSFRGLGKPPMHPRMDAAVDATRRNGRFTSDTMPAVVRPFWPRERCVRDAVTRRKWDRADPSLDRRLERTDGDTLASRCIDRHRPQAARVLDCRRRGCWLNVPICPGHLL